MRLDIRPLVSFCPDALSTKVLTMRKGIVFLNVRFRWAGICHLIGIMAFLSVSGQAVARELYALRELRGMIRSAAFSSDGKSFALGFHAGSPVVLYETKTGKLKETIPIEFHTYAIAFSPDGKFVAISTQEIDNGKCPVIMWNIPGRKAELTLTGHQDVITSLIFSPDGKLLASADERGAINLWDVATGQPLGTLKEHVEVACIAFSPDGKMLASGGHDRTVLLWNVASRRIIASLKDQKGNFLAVAFSKNGKTLFSVEDTGDLLAWDITSQKPRTRIMPLSRHMNLSVAAFSPDRETVALGSEEGMLVLYNAGSGKAKATWSHSKLYEVRCLAFGPEGETLLSAAHDSSPLGEQSEVALWDLTKLNQLPSGP